MSGLGWTENDKTCFNVLCFHTTYMMGNFQSAGSHIGWECKGQQKSFHGGAGMSKASINFPACLEGVK